MMISEELLSKVLDIPIIKNSIYMSDNNEIAFHCINTRLGVKATRRSAINIYELAHKCKEWAYKERYTLIVENCFDKGCDCTLSTIPNNTLGYLFDAKTEPEAIFLACEWILENKNK